MPIKVTCSQCGGVLHAPDDSSGKRGRCPTCGTVLTIIGEFVGPVPPAPPQFGAPPAALPPRPSTTPVTNPWGSLPGGPEEPAAGYSGAAPAPMPRPTYELAKDPPPARGSSIPAPSEPVPSSRGSRLPPDPRKVSVQDPFAKPGKPNDGGAETNARWARAYRGLGWVRTGILFCLLGTLAFAALPILQAFNVNLPNQNPGSLKIADFSQAQEIRLFATAGALLLGLLCVAIGRIGVSGAPAASHAGSTATFASLATLIALAGFVAVGAITGLAMKDTGFIPQFTPQASQFVAKATLADMAATWGDGVFLPKDDMTGQIQGFGAAALVGFGLLAEIWFVAALGRISASLRHPRAVGRVNRFVVIMGLLFALKVVALIAARVYYRAWFEANIWSKWEHLEDKWKTIGPLAVVALVGLVVALMYWRMVGGVREAIRENADVTV
jgi:hypothetical protein